jgi:hypothetical protein
MFGAVVMCIIGALFVANGVSRTPEGRGILQPKPIPIWFARYVHLPLGIALFATGVFYALRNIR